LTGMFLVLLGACSTQPMKVASPAQTCPEVIVPAPVLVPIPAELLQYNSNPAIPSQGDNAALLDWAMACANNSRKYKDQLRRLRGISDE
jgi:hypothetical protein